MADRKYYVLCENNCKFESMTKEQILAAIAHAIETGSVGDCDTGFITKIKEQNAGRSLSFWVGTSAEYNAIEKKTEDCFYIITDDTTGEDIKKDIEALKKSVDDLAKRALLSAQIIVTCVGGAVTCTDKNGEVVKGIQNGDEWTFIAETYGEYTLTGTLGTLTASATVTVDAVKQYRETLAFYSDNFAMNDWATIASVINNGINPETWKVGDVKKIESGDLAGEEAHIRIIGKNHDTYVDGGKAPYTFMLYISDRVTSDALDRPMQSEGNVTDGWQSTDMYKTYVPEIRNLLPSEFRTNLKYIIKNSVTGDYRNGTQQIKAMHELNCLLAKVEIDGTTENFYATEGEQYEFFKNGNSAPRYSWTRTQKEGDDRFMETDNNGVVSMAALNSNERAATMCFCL